MGGRHLADWFLITHLGDQDFILGMPWLKKYNPQVDWKKKTVKFPDSISPEEKLMIPMTTDTQLLIRFIKAEHSRQIWKQEAIEGDSQWDKNGIWIRSKTLISQKLQHELGSKDKSTQLPKEYEPWKMVFEKEASE